MAESSGRPVAASLPFHARLMAPWTWLRRRREGRFLREQAELRAYFQEATPIALMAQQEYTLWHDVIAEPIQDTQKAANASATFWWRITEGLRRFDLLIPPQSATRYHRFFGEAMRNASLGSDAVKNGFRANKTYEVSRGLGFFDQFVTSMSQAETELGRLLREYRLLEDGEKQENP